MLCFSTEYAIVDENAFACYFEEVWNLVLGADLLLSALEAQGVDLVFGLPGGTVIPLYDRLRHFNIQHILTRHEQGAAHAADGYARATGKVGVCFATSGPGATNLVTGIATANMDSIPMVCIMGQVVSSLLGKDGFQEAYMVGVCQPICKHTYAVTDAAQIPDIIAEAFFVASTGRPGPVVIDIPKDIFSQDRVPPLEGGKVRNRIAMKFKPYHVNKEQVRRVVKLLENAKKPLLVIGGGVNHNAKGKALLYAIAQKGKIPVANTLMGKGAFPHGNPYYLGMPGMHGTTEANYAIQHCDCLIAVGMRFDDRVTSEVDQFAPYAQIVHVDIDPAEIGKNVPVDLPIVADACDFLEALDGMLPELIGQAEWLEDVAKSKKMVKSPEGSILPPKEVYEIVDELIDEETIIVTDVGQHQMWAALFLNSLKPRTFLTSGGLGTMGYGFPAAIGAQFGQPESNVVLITGDGSFQMNLQELAVVKKYHLPIKICLMNNGYLGMVRQWQEMFYEGNYAETTLDVAPNWEKLALAYDVNYIKIENLAQCKKELGRVLRSKEPWFIDFMVDDMANVFPMVPAGSSLDEIVGEFEDEA